MDNLEPITRNEMFLNGDDLEPITREEMILAGADLEPITRHEWFLKKYRGGGGGGEYDLVNIPNLPADIASFNDGTDLPMASLKVAVTPYQDLHGYDAPWAGGAGRNLLSVGSRVDGTIANVRYTSDDEYLYLNGTKQGSGYANITSLTITLQAGTYYIKALPISGSVSGGDITVYPYDGSANLTGSVLNDERTLTLDSEKTFYFRFGLWSDGMVVNNYKVGIVISKTANIDKFYPYSNICPIIGWDEAVVTRCGKNLWSLGNISGTKQTDVDVNIPIGSWTFSCEITSADVDGTTSLIIFYYDDDTTSLTRLNRNTRVSHTLTATKHIKKISFYAGYNSSQSAGDTFTFANIQLEEGTTATTYEPYNGATYTIDLDGTRYGGVLDATNGTMTITNVLKTFSSGISKHATIDNAFIINNAFSDAKAGQCKCNMFKYNSAVLSGLNLGEFSIDTSYTRLAIKTDVYATAEEFNNAISNNPITVWYPIATPITVQLAPQPVKSIEGENNIFANCGQITEVKYFKKA